MFVDGCFWHGCSCKYLPRSNKRFWREKIEANQRRDKIVVRRLRREGWAAARVKECRVDSPATIRKITEIVAGRRRLIEEKPPMVRGAGA